MVRGGPQDHRDTTTALHLPREEGLAWARLVPLHPVGGSPELEQAEAHCAHRTQQEPSMDLSISRVGMVETLLIIMTSRPYY